MSKNIKLYTDRYMADFGFEAEMVHYRKALLLERLQHYTPRHVLELGCGNDLLASSYNEGGASWDRWTIVEPSDVFSDCARKSELPNVTVIQGFFEQVSDQIVKAPDLLLCSGLLHEVPDSDQLLAAMVDVMDSETILHINVPNAQSLHRRLAVSMGIIEHVREISERNTALDQPRVYDRLTLIEQVKSHGLQIVKSGGYFLKPFTHQQMKPLTENLGRPVMDGLYELGKSEPDWASEIYVEVRCL